MPSLNTHYQASSGAHGFGARFGQPWFLVFAILVGALLIGLSAATGNWILLAIMAAGIVICFRPIEISLGLFALAIPFDSIAVIGDSGEGGRTITWFVGALAAVVLIACGLIGKRFRQPPRAAKWWVLFAAWASLTTGWAVEPSLAFGRLPTMAALLLLYLAVTCMQLTKKELSWVLSMAILGGCLASAYAAYQFSLHHLFAHARDPRATLLLGDRQEDPNFFASTLLVPASLAIAAFLSSRKSIRAVAALAAIIVLTWGIFISSSRGGLLSLAVVLLTFFWYYRKDRRVLVCSVALLPLVWFVPKQFFSRVQEAGSSGGAGRLDIWQAGFEALKSHGLIGAGLDNFPLVYQNVAGFASTFYGTNRSAHNIYLNAAVEVGLIGIILMLAAFYTQMQDARRVARQCSAAIRPTVVGLQAACWSMLAAGMFLDMFWRKQFWFAWMMLAATLRFIQTRDQQHQETPSLL